MVAPSLICPPDLFTPPCLFCPPVLLGENLLLDGDCLLFKLCLLELPLGFSFLIGAPTSSGVLLIRGLLKFFLEELLVFWSNLFDDRGLWLKVLFFLSKLFCLLGFIKFLGFSISWIGGLAGLLLGGDKGLLRFLSWIGFDFFFSLRFVVVLTELFALSCVFERVWDWILETISGDF